MSMNACARKGNGWRGDEITLKKIEREEGGLEKKKEDVS